MKKVMWLLIFIPNIIIGNSNFSSGNTIYLKGSYFHNTLKQNFYYKEAYEFASRYKTNYQSYAVNLLFAKHYYQIDFCFGLAYNYNEGTFSSRLLFYNDGNIFPFPSQFPSRFIAEFAGITTGVIYKPNILKINRNNMLKGDISIFHEFMNNFRNEITNRSHSGTETYNMPMDSKILHRFIFSAGLRYELNNRHSMSVQVPLVVAFRPNSNLSTYSSIGFLTLGYGFSF